MHRFFFTVSHPPRGGWTVPIPGIVKYTSWAQLLQAVRAKQGAAYRGDDSVAFMICERDPSFCHNYVDGVVKRQSAPGSVPEVKRAGCGSCAARAAARAARNNGGGLK